MALFDEEAMDLGRKKVRGLAFAEDKVIMADSIESLQSMLSRLNSGMTKMGLKINVNNPKIMVFERKGEQTVCNIFLDDEKIERVDKYMNLGSNVVDELLCIYHKI